MKALYNTIKRNLQMISILVLILGSFLACFDGSDSTLKPKLQIKGHKILSKEEILQLLGINSNTTIKDLNLKEIESQLLSHPRVLSAKAHLRSKNHVLIHIEEKRAVYVVNVQDTLYEIDSAWNILSEDQVRDKDLLVLTGDFQISNGKVSGRLLKDLVQSIEDAWRLFPSLKDRISEVEIKRDGNILLYVYRPRKIRVMLGSAMDNLQIRKLYAALAYFEEKKLQVKTLDLRGDDAVFQ
jgi:cell division protein FtsQ